MSYLIRNDNNTNPLSMKDTESGFVLKKRKLLYKTVVGFIFALFISLLVYNQLWLLGGIGLFIFSRFYKI